MQTTEARQRRKAPQPNAGKVAFQGEKDYADVSQ